MSKPEPKFSKTVWILKDLKKKSSWDVIKITSRIDDKPVLFDFGAGNVMVIRYTIETFDGLINLFVPFVNSFLKKIIVGKFFELGSKRCYNYEMVDTKVNDWIIYVNRIKNLTQVNLKLGDRLEWQSQPKTKNIDFPFDENWLEKSLPIKNNLVDCKAFFENLEDIDPDTLLSLPLKLLRLQAGNQIEVTEPTGSIIKNTEFLALNHKQKIIRLYVPYFLRDLVSQLSEKLLQFNIVVNRLKVFYKKTNEATYAGFLWDPTLSGFILQPKEQSEKSLSIKDGDDIFVRIDGHSLFEYIVNDHKKLEDKLHQKRKRSLSGRRNSSFKKEKDFEKGKIQGKQSPNNMGDHYGYEDY